MIESFYILFIIACSVQLFFLWGVFSKSAFYNKKYPPLDIKTPISVVVSIHNEENNLKKLIPALLNQQHHCFEIIIVDDRSSDESPTILQEFSEFIHIIRIDSTPGNYSPKKYALEQGIQKSKYQNILLTDADCIPASNDWISIMSSYLSSDKKVVISLSPYELENTLLNKTIQFETFYTALQFISLALCKEPYMALGRNVLYNKELFIRQNGFNKHKHILGGDDDLFINQIANSKIVATCLDKRAYTISNPSRNWGSWISQKHRHLSVGKFYRLRHKLILGALHLSNMIFYLSFFTHFLMDRLDLVITTGFFLRTVSQIVIFDKSAKTYGMKITSFLSPIWDMGYTLYSCFLGTYSSLIGRKKWK